MDQRNSGLGIASFVLSIVTAVMLFFLIVIAAVMESSTPGGIDESAPGAVVLGLFMIAFLLIDLLAVGLGIGGLMKRDTKKVLAILGTCIASVSFLGTVSLMIIGNLT